VLEIGKGSAVGHHTILDLNPDPLLGELAHPSLSIGLDTTINEFNNIRAGNAPVAIGSGCLISQFVSIIAANHGIARSAPIREQVHELPRTGISIGDDVWIGVHAVILPGVSIGTGAVVGAGAVVTKDVPDFAVVTGVPAEVRRYRT